LNTGSQEHTQVTIFAHYKFEIVRPLGKLTTLEAAIFTLKPKGKGCCPKCKKANVVLVVY